jgi:hypothetical protein
MSLSTSRLQLGRGVLRSTLGAALVLITASPAALAQTALNENCIVSVLNRNTRVRPDGSWVLPNIPANFGLVRARATCVEDGQTISGESQPFLILAGGSVNVPRIVLGPTTPIPRSVVLTAPTTQLTSIGATSAITVTGHYADGSTRNLTSGTTGTTYVISNPLIATISSDGLVQGLASGSVLIQATNEGTSGFMSMQVVLSADSDGDGLPDDVELSLGLNPNNPADAVADADRDGLTTAAEFAAGTNINDADSDDDSLADGEEVFPGADGFVTNPLLADTDGDGVRDALEVTSGSNPTDAASVNLGGALSRITVAPATFVMTVNSVQGVAFQQLTVTGELLDGTALNLTSTLRGTNYASDDLAICNFGAPDGRVFAGDPGECTITVTNSGFSAEAQGTVSSFTPVPLSFVAVPGFANNVDVSGNFAYVAAGAAGLQVVNVANRAAPAVVGAFDTAGNANDVQVLGTLAFVADGVSGLQIIDVSNPAAPVRVGGLDTPGDVWDVTVRENRAYLADGVAGLRIVDVSDPAAPVLLGSIDPAGTQKGVDVDPGRQLAVLASGTSGLHVVDVSNPAAPVLRGVLAGGDVRDVALQGTFAYLADFQRSFTAVDVSNPAAPLLGSSTPQSLGGLLNDVVVQNNFALGAEVFFVNGVPIVNIDAPANPVPRAIVNFGSFRDDDGHGIAADGSFLYLAAALGSAGTENGASGNSRLYIGQYLAREDRQGIAPTVAIASPQPTSAFIEGSPVAVRVNATDDIAVASVSLVVDGVAVASDTSFPYEFTLTLPSGVSNVVIGASAVDLGGNVGEAENVSLALIPDPLTTVIGSVTTADGAPVAGATVAVGARSGVTNADGTFSIAGVPTVAAQIAASASFTAPDGSVLTGVSAGRPPVRGGITDVGTIVVTSAVISEDFGAGFVAGQWHLAGNATRDAVAEALFLTRNGGNQRGRAFFTAPFLADRFRAEFDYDISGGSGADGLTFAWTAHTFYPPGAGGGLDFVNAPGYAIEFDTYQFNAGDPPGRHIAVLQNSISNHLASAIVETRGQHHVVIEFDSGRTQVFFDGVRLIDFTIPNYTPFDAFFGFTAATGGLTDNHVIDNFVLTVPGTPYLVNEPFDFERNGVAQLNYSAFANWTVTRGSVDLIGLGSNDLLPGNGLYLDLDGSTASAGRLQSSAVFNLAPGTYELQFDLAGSRRGDTNTVTVSLGTVYSESFTVASSQPFTRITRNITVGEAETGRLVFDHAGGDNVGLLLDKVKLRKTQ